MGSPPGDLEDHGGGGRNIPSRRAGRHATRDITIRGGSTAALRIEASYDQLDRIDAKLREIEAVIDTLPPESTEHSVIGYRFLQNRTWDYIAARIPYSSRRLEDYEYMGLDTLLMQEHIRAAVQKFKKQEKKNG